MGGRERSGRLSSLSHYGKLLMVGFAHKVLPAHKVEGGKHGNRS